MIALLISGCTNASDPQKNYISEETAINIAKKQDFNLNFESPSCQVSSIKQALFKL
jgi:PBP1b-binding outer membrane lipoprotein LpoB